MTYPARCPGCGSPATNTLFTDPSIPVYLCGNYATMQGPLPCRPSRHLIGLGPDVVAVDSADMRDILELVDIAVVAVMRAAG